MTELTGDTKAVAKALQRARAAIEKHDAKAKRIGRGKRKRGKKWSG